MPKVHPDETNYVVLDDLMQKKHLDLGQIAGILRCNEKDLAKKFSVDNYMAPETAGILADAFGYNRDFLLTGEGNMYVDFRDENQVYKLWEKDRLKQLHSYLYRMSRCWEHPKAMEIFDTYDELQRTDSKMEILIKSQKIERLFDELLTERNERNNEEKKKG